VSSSLLPRQNRLKAEHRFRLLRKRGTVVRTPYFLLSFLPNNQPSTFVGFVATKKLGKAAKRNRALRVLREAVRTVLPQITPGFDIVLVAHSRVLDVGVKEVLPVLMQTLRGQHLWQENN
jgi:ribonuclease P protein component